MKYRRLKTLNSTSTPVMRYYKLADGETPPYCNCFYIIDGGEAKKQEGVKTGPELIGFSHGGNNLGKGLIFLDINETPLYMGIFEEGEDTRPAIGDLVNGYQRVIDTHYDGDAGVDGKNDFGWGVETMNNPYYIFHIEQNMAESATKTVDDEGSGEISPSSESTDGGHGRPKNTVTVTFDATGTKTGSNIMSCVYAPDNDNGKIWKLTMPAGSNLADKIQEACEEYYITINFARDWDSNRSNGPLARKFTVDDGFVDTPAVTIGWFPENREYDPEYHDIDSNKFDCDQVINEDITIYAVFDEAEITPASERVNQGGSYEGIVHDRP